MKKIRRFSCEERPLEFANEFLERAQRRNGAARRPTRNGYLDGVPQRSFVSSRGLAERVDSGLTDAAGRQVQNSQQGNIIFRMHCQSHIRKRILYFGAVVKAESAH